MVVAIGLAAATRPAAADDGPATPTPPWFIVADPPSPDPAFTIDRWLWNREASALRYCRKDAVKGEFTCAGDVGLPKGHWVIDRVQDQPDPGVASSLRFYSPDRDLTLVCRAAMDGGMSCG